MSSAPHQRHSTCRLVQNNISQMTHQITSLMSSYIYDCLSLCSFYMLTVGLE